MEQRRRSEKLCDIAMSIIPVAGAVYHGRKGHRQGFIEASEIYEKKCRELEDRNKQMRRDVFGEEHVFICPEAWDSDFWQKKIEIFIQERAEKEIAPRKLIVDFLRFCIDTFPKRRLAQTLKDMEVICDILDASPEELAAKPQDDIEDDIALAIDFLSFYREGGDIKKLKDELVAFLPGTNGCNFLVLGQSGVGKSSLLNSLLGVKKFDTGTGLPVTKKGIFESEGELDGIKVRVFDSWGLEPGEVDEWKRLIKDAQEKHDVTHKVEDWFHAVVYCVQAGGHRIVDVDRDIISSLLADDMYVVVALTKADLCSKSDAEVLRQELVRSCKKLLPQNVIDTCAGGETRSGKTDPFGIPDLKKAILFNYKKTIQAHLPTRCIYLAHQEIEKFRMETSKWIESLEWQYDENENNRPLKNKCDVFFNYFLKEKFPAIIHGELESCSRYARNLATVLKFDDLAGILPHVPPDLGFWASIGNFITKAWNWIWGDNTKDEHARLNAKLDDFCKKMESEIEKQKPEIAKKVKEVLK